MESQTDKRCNTFLSEFTYVIAKIKSESILKLFFFIWLKKTFLNHLLEKELKLGDMQILQK